MKKNNFGDVHTITEDVDNHTKIGNDTNITVIGEDDNNETVLVSEDGQDEQTNKITSEPYHLSAGMILQERYRIESVIGFGGFGITYKAMDTRLDNQVAIKEYYFSSIVTRIPGKKDVEVYADQNKQEFERGLGRFLDEAKNLAKFSEHTNIVNVYDFFEENGTAYIVMEFLDGLSLKDYVNNAGGKINVDETIKIIRHVIKALNSIHKNSILHRDISPDNIYICHDGRIKLIDFGAARFFTDDENKRVSIILKPGFAPPEQYRMSGNQGPWTDIYALGATMYRALTGIMPDESINRVVNDMVVHPSSLDKEIPKYLNNILMKCIAITPELRFQSADELDKVLEKKKAVLEVKKDLRRRRYRRTVSILVILLIISVTAFGSLYYYISLRKAAQLVPCTVSIWLPVDSLAYGEDKKNIFFTMLSDFMNDYPFINIDVEVIEQSEYRERILRAYNNGTLPVIFDSSAIDPVILNGAIVLNDVLDLLNLNDYYYLNNYNRFFPNHNQMPMGFDIPLLFINPFLLEKLLIENANDFQSFINENSILYLGDISKYSIVQQELAGVYEIISLPTDSQFMSFSNIWSVSSTATEDEQNAGMRVIYYMMSEFAQDIYSILNEKMLPLNKSIMKIYLNVNPEIAPILTNIEDKEYIIVMDDDYLQSKYTQLLNDSEFIQLIKSNHTLETISN